MADTIPDSTATTAVLKIGAPLSGTIDDNLDKAAQLKAEAEAAVAAYEKALAESRAHAHAVIKEAADRLAKQAEERNPSQPFLRDLRQKGLFVLSELAGSGRPAQRDGRPRPG